MAQSALPSTNLTVGVISDTHGLLRQEARSELRGCDLVIHAGDVGKPEILDALRAMAPVVRWLLCKEHYGKSTWHRGRSTGWKGRLSA